MIDIWQVLLLDVGQYLVRSLPMCRGKRECFARFGLKSLLWYVAIEP